MSLRHLFACCALVGGLAVPASGLPTSEELAAALRKAVESGESREAQVGRLSRLGADVVPEIVRVLAGRSSLQVERHEQELLVEALRTLPEEPGIQEVISLFGSDPSMTDVTSAARVLGTFAGGRGIAPLFALVRGLEPGQITHPRIGEEFEGALAAILRRDPLAYGYLREELGRSDRALITCIVGALGRAPSDDASLLLERLLGRATTLDEHILEAYGMQGIWVPRCSEGACGATVRRYLTDNNPRLRKHAIVASGRLGDTASVHALVTALDDRDRRVRGAALWSLRRISGLGWAADPVRWERELQAEEDWLVSRFPQLADDFLDPDAATSRAAMDEVATRVLVRHETAHRFAPALDHPEPMVPIAACEALARLGGPEALAVLEQARVHRLDEVRLAAERAVQTLRAKGDETLDS